MKIYLKILLLALIVLAGNGAIGYAVYKSNQNLDDSKQWVKQSEDIILESNKILSISKDLKTSSRGFVITNDSTFLEPLNQAKEIVFTDVRKLRQLTRDNSSQQALVDSLNFYLHKRLEFSQLAVDLRRNQGLTTAVDFIATGKGQDYSDRLHEITNEILQVENNLLRQREQTSQKDEAMFDLFIIVMFILMTLFTVIMLIVTGNSFFNQKEKEKRASELVIANKELEFQNEEKEKRASELVIANKELKFQNEEKGKRASELDIANKELQFQNEEKEKRASELVIAKEEAEESERLKSNFLSNMSHELRTPMIGILGFSKMLTSVEEIKEVKEYSEVIYESANRLMDTLNLILDISMIESDEAQLSYNTIELVQTIRETIELFSINAKEKGIEISLESEFEELDLYIDNKALSSVMNNLINNAVKFTNEGGITILLKTEQILDGDTESNQDNVLNPKKWIIIEVKDTGIGIHEKDREVIFELFRQASEGLGRSFDGSGLGLSLTKKYVNLLGGNISVNSKFGEGTTFTVRLPLVLSEDNVLEFNNESSDDNHYQPLEIERDNVLKTILIVDDDVVTAKFIKTVLKGLYELDISYNAKEALESVGKKQFDAILMDINLGKSKNGIYTTGEIRKMSNYKNTPIIAMTAFAMHGDREEFIEGGCTDYISKPFDENELIDILRKNLTNID